jgi:DNA-binding NarL/FixJ family response regulator
VAGGRSSKQIAVELRIADQTVKHHTASIFRKLHASSRTEAVVLAIKHGLVSII